jgi:hypothetical protein
MDGIIRFQKTITKIMTEYADARTGSSEKDDHVSYKIIADEKQHRYQLVLTGWHKRERIYHVLFHVEINNNKIWIEEDNSEDSIAEMLVEKGISKKDIVLGYFSEFHRQHTEYAVA